MITNFLFGGFIFAFIEYIINKIDNPELASVISMIPIGYLTTFLIKKNLILILYIKNIIFVVACILIVTVFLLFFLLRFVNIDEKIPMYS